MNAENDIYVWPSSLSRFITSKDSVSQLWRLLAAVGTTFSGRGAQFGPEDVPSPAISQESDSLGKNLPRFYFILNDQVYYCKNVKGRVSHSIKFCGRNVLIPFDVLSHTSGIRIVPLQWVLVATIGLQ